MSPACLICGSDHIQTVEERSGNELFRLWNDLGRAVTDEDLRRCRCGDRVMRYQCRDCGFSFFDPSQSGDGLFYEHLSTDDSAYYNAQRPEFDHALQHALSKNHRNVLDVGCGSGNFLDLARKAGLSTSGMELNDKAAAAALDKGHHIYEGLLDENFAQAHSAEFDMVTLFQVVEHLADPVGLLRLARRLLRPGGSLFFSVPNSRGLYQLYPLDPHQWPPHHISRWRTEDFPSIARKIGMVHLYTAGDRLHGGSLADFHMRNNRALAVLGGEISPLADLQVKALSNAYRALRLKHVVRNLGLSIYCCLKEPDHNTSA
jgi:2-polyprenyl-3-methyl-5-hydroxy-6-metoxy-1,4-benzoquinol methylase